MDFYSSVQLDFTINHRNKMAELVEKLSHDPPEIFAGGRGQGKQAFFAGDLLGVCFRRYL